jgi:hypothetical protein
MGSLADGGGGFDLRSAFVRIGKTKHNPDMSMGFVM